MGSRKSVFRGQSKKSRTKRIVIYSVSTNRKICYCHEGFTFSYTTIFSSGLETGNCSAVSLGIWESSRLWGKWLFQPWSFHHLHRYSSWGYVASIMLAPPSSLSQSYVMQESPAQKENFFLWDSYFLLLIFQFQSNSFLTFIALCIASIMKSWVSFYFYLQLFEWNIRAV